MRRTALIGWLILGGIMVLRAQVSLQVERSFFPDVELDPTTPALQKNKGFTQYRELIAFLETLQAEKPDWIQIEYIGTTEKGKPVPMVILKKPGSTEKIRVWFQGGLHGNEPASTEGLLYLMEKIVRDQSFEPLFNTLELAIVPVANPDGFEHQKREAANGLDLNRDQTKFAHPESFYLKKAFCDYNPHFAVDFHEYRPYRRDFMRFGKTGATTSTDAYFLLTGNLNVPEPIRNYLYQVVYPDASRHLNDLGLRTGIYNTTFQEFGKLYFSLGAASPRSSATSYALSNCIGLLMEIRGVGLGREHFQRRVFTIYTLAKFYLELAEQDADQIKAILKESAAITADRDKDIVVVSSRPKEPFDWPHIDLHTQRLATTRVLARNGLNAQARLEREKPVAYLLPSDQVEVIRRLQVLGIRMEERNSPSSLEVEQYRLVDAWESPDRWEGIHQLNLTTRLERSEVPFPQGYYYIPTRQENAALLFETLEPEAVNSMFRYRVFRTEIGDILPIYRYHGEPLN